MSPQGRFRSWLFLTLLIVAHNPPQQIRSLTSNISVSRFKMFFTCKQLWNFCPMKLNQSDSSRYVFIHGTVSGVCCDKANRKLSKHKLGVGMVTRI